MKKKDNTITKIAVTGLGRIAIQLENDPKRYKPCTHLGALQKFIHKNPSRYALYFRDINDENIQKATQFLKAKLPQFNAASFQELNSIPQPDIHIIATPTETHMNFILESIHLKIPRLVIEKPIAVHLKETKKIREELTKYKGNIWVNYERRFHPKYIQLKENIQKGIYGNFIHYEARLTHPSNNLYEGKIKQKKDNKKYYSEGILLRDTTHMVDLVQYFFGRINHYDEHRDKNIHILYFKHRFRQAKGSLTTTSNAPYFNFGLTLYFEKFTIYTGNGYYMEQKVDKKSLSPYARPIYRSDYKLSQKDNPFLNFYRSVLYNTKNHTSINDAIHNVEILAQK